MGVSAVCGGILLVLDGKLTEGFSAIVAGIGIITSREAVRKLENGK